MYCRQCGTKLDDNVKFCGYCGTPVEQKPVSQPVIPEPVAVVPEPIAAPEPVTAVPEPVAIPEPVVAVPEPIVETEPEVEIEPVVVEAEPIVELEPVIVEPEPIVELEPEVVEPEPVAEIEPVVVEPEPIVEPEPEVVVLESIVETEPVVVEPEPIVEPEPEVVVPEPIVEPEPVADTEFVVIPEVHTEQPQVEWQEPADEMEWQAPAGEEVWSGEAENYGWQQADTNNETWSDTWSETAQTAGWNRQNVDEVPLVIEPKKRNVGLTIFTIIGTLAVTALIVVCAILMNGSDDEYDYDDFWASDYEEELLEDYEDELEDALEDALEEELEILEDSIVEESELVEEVKEVTLNCGAAIPFDASSVDLSGMIVNDLTGIEQCTALQSVTINGGSLTDLSPLLGLTQLNSLVLHNVPVSDIQSLKDLPSLLYLDITDTQVSAQQVKDLKAAMPNLTIVGYTTSTYEITKKDCTWQEAVEICEEQGGHLVTISDETEMKKVEEALKNTDLKYFWMGGYSEGDTWIWITGEPWGGYENWFPGEPSKQDADGTLEYCLCLWNVDDSGWTMNDQRNDLPSFTSTQGRIGYICEYEAIAGYK